MSFIIKMGLYVEDNKQDGDALRGGLPDKEIKPLKSSLEILVYVTVWVW